MSADANVLLEAHRSADSAINRLLVFMVSGLVLKGMVPDHALKIELIYGNYGARFSKERGRYSIIV
jgi:hypothetical protein